MNHFYKKIIYVFAICMLLQTFAGCEQEQKPPSPPRAETKLVVELLTSIKNKDYNLAKKKLQRLKQISQKDVNLASIKVFINMNLVINKAQSYLNSYKIDKAKKVIKDTILDYGEMPILVKAKEKLDTLKKVKNLVEDISEVYTSEEIAKASAKIQKICSSKPFLEDKLSNKASNMIKNSEELMKKEKKMAIWDLKAEIDTTWLKDNKLTASMISELAVESQKDLLVENYKKAMSDNWRNLKEPLDYNSRDGEFLLFRYASVNLKKRKKLFKKILYSQPVGFTSLFMRATILNFNNKKKQAEELISTIAQKTNLKEDKLQGKLSLTPRDIDGFSGFSKFNPLVLQPFFLYFKD